MSQPLEAATIFREHGRYVYRLLRRLGIPQSDLDDASQEVFLVVHRKLDSFEGRGSVRAWVYGICVRVVTQYRRRRKANPVIVSGDDVEAIDVTTPVESLGAEEARKAFAAILDQLDDDRRTVFVLFELEGLTMQEIVELVGCPLQTGYSRLNKAREAVESAVRRYLARRNFK